MATITVQDVVLGSRPSLADLPEDPEKVLPLQRCCAHVHGLSESMLPVLPGDALIDTCATNPVAETPLVLEDLHTSMERANANRVQEIIDRLNPTVRSHVVDVKEHA
jgi:hypothetical protein